MPRYHKYIVNICSTELCTWSDTRRQSSGSPWKRSISRISFWGIKSSKPLWRETSSPLPRIHLWCPCTAPLKLGGTCAWSWNMLKVCSFIIQLTAAKSCFFCNIYIDVSRWRLCYPFKKHGPPPRGYGQNVLCRDSTSSGVSPQLRHSAQGPQTRQVRPFIWWSCWRIHLHFTSALLSYHLVSQDSKCKLFAN